MSILRFVDPTSGKILIDGVDISKIGLHDLRSRVVCQSLVKPSYPLLIMCFSDFHPSRCDIVLGHASGEP
jgi:hypothetical protein